MRVTLNTPLVSLSNRGRECWDGCSPRVARYRRRREAVRRGDRRGAQTSAEDTVRISGPFSFAQVDLMFVLRAM